MRAARGGFLRSRVVVGTALLGAAALGSACPVPAGAEEGPQAAVLLDRLCNQRLRANEEDRLLGLISLSVRATIAYEGGVFSPDLIDDAVQEAVGAMMEACPQIAAADPPRRLGLAVEIVREMTVQRMQDRAAGYSVKQTEQATAADLSEELSAPEIDAWLDGLPPRQRALALFLYSSNLQPEEIAAAVGLKAPALPGAFREVKGNLLKFFRSETDSTPLPAAPARPAIEYREAGQNLAALMAPAPAQPASVRITGISSDLYAGWSLLATVAGLDPERSLELREPMLLEPDTPDRKRMIAVALEEITERSDTPRRFLVKAYAIDAEKEGAGLHDSFHVAAPAIDNAEAQQTLRSRGLAAIEIARCLWRDYGTGDDPGLCR